MTKIQKSFLDAIVGSEPNLQGRFYTVDFIASKNPAPGISYARFRGVLDSLVDMKVIAWADKAHSAFTVSETGFGYRELERLEKRQRRKERFIGFVTGIVSGIIVGIAVSSITHMLSMPTQSRPPESPAAIQSSSPAPATMTDSPQ